MRLRQAQLGLVQDVRVAQAQVVVLVEEALLLHARHVQHVQVADHRDQIAHLHVRAGRRGVDAVDDVLRGLELVRADQHEAHVAEPAQRLDQRVHGASEGQVAAQADGQVSDAAEARLQGGQVGQGLRGVHVAAVARVDDGDRGGAGGDERRALLRVADGDGVDVVGHGFDGVGDRLALGHRGQLRAGEADDLAAQAQHGRLEAQAGAGARLVEQGGQHTALAGVRDLTAMRVDVCGLVQEFENLVTGQIVKRHDALANEWGFRRWDFSRQRLTFRFVQVATCCDLSDYRPDSGRSRSPRVHLVGRIVQTVEQTFHDVPAAAHRAE